MNSDSRVIPKTALSILRDTDLKVMSSVFLRQESSKTESVKVSTKWRKYKILMYFKYKAGDGGRRGGGGGQTNSNPIPIATPGNTQLPRIVTLQTSMQ